MLKESILCLSLMAMCLSCSSGKEKEAEKEETMTKVDDRPVEVKANVLEFDDFSYELISNGTIAAMQKAELRFQSQENIVKIYVKNGDKVAKGQRLAELDKFKLENSMAQSSEAMERAKLDLKDVLIGQGQGHLLSDTAKIPAEVMKIAKIRSNYQQSQNNYIMAEYHLKNATLYAPFSGVVANLNVKEHNYPGGDPFCTIIDNQRPEVIFNILESELPLIKLNDKVIISPFSMASFSTEGRITEINPIIDRNGMVKVKAVINNIENRFFEGMNVKVRVQRLLGKQLAVPKSAVVLRANRKVVFTIRGGRAQWIYVFTGQENSHSYVVTEGLNAGDSIIYEGNFNLADQSRVIVKK